jgi:hypothetical protein
LIVFGVDKGGAVCDNQQFKKEHKVEIKDSYYWKRREKQWPKFSMGYRDGIF